MHILLGIITTAGIWAWAVKYQLIIAYVFAVLIEQLPPPDETSSKVYKYIYAVAQVFAANLRRSKDAVLLPAPAVPAPKP